MLTALVRDNVGRKGICMSEYLEEATQIFGLEHSVIKSNLSFGYLPCLGVLASTEIRRNNRECLNGGACRQSVEDLEATTTPPRAIPSRNIHIPDLDARILILVNLHLGRRP